MTKDYQKKESLKRNTRKLLSLTREIAQFFPNTDRPMIVANIGGFSMDKLLPREVMPSYYENFAESLMLLDTSDVEIIPQTMAPFSWHFGGQRFQNMFVQADEILYWCEQLNLRMCFDICIAN